MQHYSKHRITILLTSCILMLVILMGCTKEKQGSEGAPSKGLGVVETKSVLATIGREDVPTGTDPALGNKPAYDVYFNERGRSVAYVTKRGEQYRVVFNGQAGINVQAVDRISLSVDGKRIAFSAMIDGKWGMVIDGQPGVSAESVGEPVFSPDGKHVAYAVQQAGKWRIAVDEIVYDGCGSDGCKIGFSADSSKIVIEKSINHKGQSRMFLSALDLKEIASWDHIVRSQVLFDQARTRFAAVQEDNGKQRVVQVRLDGSGKDIVGRSYESISDLAFGSDGRSLTYVGVKKGKRFLVLNDQEELLPEGNIVGPLMVRPDGKGVGVIMATDKGHALHEVFMATAAKKSILYEEVRFLTYDTQSGKPAFAARKGSKWSVVVDGNEGPLFDIVVTPLFSPDGKYVVYRVRNEDKRFVVVADRTGKTVKQHRAYEMVFQPVFTEDKKSIAYGVKDGNKLVWMVEKL